MGAKDGMFYAPQGIVNHVVGAGEFVFASVGLDHGHIFGMTQCMLDAGATLKWVYDKDPAKVEMFVQKFPQAKVARSVEEVLQDKEVQMVVSAIVTSQRADLGIRVMKSGKDYFVDKAPLTTLGQLENVKLAIAQTGRKYAVCYSERLQSEAAMRADELVKGGAIGKVMNVIGMGPHRLNAPSRPDWFFKKETYGGILCDIGSHQIEQFLFYTGAKDAQITSSAIANYQHPEYPEFEDFGFANIIGDNGTSGYFRVDWFTPDGLSSWGDGRVTILGTDGYIEMRKYVDVGRSDVGENLYWVDGHSEHYENLSGKIGFPFFGQLILDCLNGTENAMTQEHALKAAELCVTAEMLARRLK